MKVKIKNLKTFFKNGDSLNYEFRIKQLEKLKESLEENEDNILSSLSIDMKKPRFEAYASELSLIYEQIDFSIENLESWMKEEKVSTPLHLQPAKSYIKASPKGLVLIISPWNYPYLLTFSPLIGAISAGNTALIKISSRAKISAKLIEKIIMETFEEDYIFATSEESSKVMPEILDEDFDHIFFTGSEEVGRNLAKLAGERLTPITLELGGKSPAIVDATCNLDLAAKKIVWGKFFNAGQTCIAPDYVLVDHNLKEELVEKMIHYIETFYSENQEESEDLARIIDIESLNRLRSLIKHENIIYGGGFNEESLYLQPSLVEATLSDKIMKEEIFGPILPILTYEDPLEIISIVEKNENPLSLYLFSEDEIMKNLIFEALNFGSACVNDNLSQLLNIHLPFGGVRNSGMGRYQGYYSFREFSNFKSILESKSNLDLKVKYPPYTKTKMAMSKLFLK